MDLSSFTGPVRQFGATVSNAAEVIRYGGLLTGEVPSEFTIAARRPMFRLRRYFPDTEGQDRPPVVLVPPLMMAAEVYDVSPSTSAVHHLHEAGLDPWVVDFGAPEREEGGLKRTVVDHVVAVNDAVELVLATTNRDVHLAGYSQGGMFAYQVAAYRRSQGIASVITFGAPVDSRATRVFGVVAEDVVTEIAGLLADHVLVHLSLPAWAARLGFRLLDPVKSTRGRIQFLLQLHDREALLPREGQRQFLDNTGYVAYPGPAIAELVKQFLAHNRMLQGGFVVGDVMSTLADITCPVLAFVGTLDSIAPPPAVRAIARAAPRAQTFEAEVPTGHFGLVVGSGAIRGTWPRAAAWVAWQEKGGQQKGEERPDGIGVLDPDAEFEPRPSTAPLHAGVDVAGYAVALARAGLGATAGGLRAVAALAGDAQQAFPRLARLERTSGSGRVSMGAILEERTRNAGGDHFFVFDDRGHTYADAGVRVDNVVRGLLSIGVRPGERVGVLMNTRPSALTAITALNRIGAVAVMLRPDGATAIEAELGEVRRIIADPEHADAARAARRVSVYVLGGGGTPRAIGPGITDLERITPALVQIPDWYVPNPGKASDLAFLLFTGEGKTTRCQPVTNGQWARSAYGTATAARLSAADTVYSVTPLHHPAGLLTSVGGALAGGSRLALTTSYDPDTFWAEVRRYGVTVVSYTWTLLHDLIEADRAPGERHHPVRLFVGSGMPPWLWQRAMDRFPSAAVLEFFVSSSEDVILANISGRKVGAKGRPIPSSAEVAVVLCDLATGEVRRDDDGLGRACGTDEVGLLIARTSTSTPGALRGVLEADDAWASTRHVFRRDADGDHHLIGAVADLVHTVGGVVAPAAAEDALGELDAVEMVAAYGVRLIADSDLGGDIPVEEELHAALSLRPGRTLDAAAVTKALAGLSALQQPAVVRVLPQIPVTTWWRPLRAALREGAATEALVTWVRKADGGYAEPGRTRRSRRPN